MLINEIPEAECFEILSRVSVGRLGCVHNSQPYIVPVYFAYESGSIYIFSTPGKKIDWMRANSQVCLEAEEITKTSEWTSVIANGRYEELSEPLHEQLLARARKLLAKRTRWWLNALAERRAHKPDLLVEPLFFRIIIDSVSGLRGLTSDN